MAVIISRHAEHRVRGRLGVPKRAVLGYAERAYAKGLAPYECGSLIRKLINTKIATYGDKFTYKIYNGFVWCFDGKILVTVLLLKNKHKRRRKPYARNKLIQDTNG
jgi:hypothetical protein